jgi:ATPase subunit of ABC transporter with duplicated ATPase domains
MKKSLVQIQNLNFSFDNNEIFDSISVAINYSDKIGLIGDNGTGKSTLLKIIAGIIKTNSVSTSEALIEYIPQIDLDLLKNDSTRVFEYIKKSYKDWWEALISLNQYFYFDIDPEREIKTLSGGEFMKLKIAIALTKNPELLILDEPTNHLDLQSINQLENILRTKVKTYVVVSHDISFLNAVTEKIWRLANKQIKQYGGNYDFFLERFSEEKEAMEAKYQAQVKRVKKIKLSYEKEKKRVARNKVIEKKINLQKSKDKFAKSYFGNRSEKKAGKAKLKMEGAIRAENLKTESLKLKQEKRVNIVIQSGTESKSAIFSIDEGNLILNNKVLISNINLKMNFGDRIHLKGRNGSGKSLLVKSMTNSFQDKNVQTQVEGAGSQELGARLYEADLQLGGLKSFNENPQITYLDQKYEIIDPEISLIDNVIAANPGIDYESIRKVLGNCLFYDERIINQKAGVLSGGELARLACAIITVSDTDLLILDEPSNNLDIRTKEVLISALKNYPGAMILISHDEDFVSKVGSNKTFEIVENELKQV